ncbi:hypothetical protein PO883_19930 [Massilia sp. DJPM01]|uniref:hypothetical protein n=1 Tax=Massilia sp. DJPM01 TaxID=3024404 RepID=UPI00259E7136|nr:hypothetical protein [Massilia sp. DJPM01]MDM5179465.1 hypothetical protein [Massilia sp. DJPM01]
MTAYVVLKHESGIVFAGTVHECLWLKRLLKRAGESPVMAELTLVCVAGASGPMPDPDDALAGSR